MSDDRIKNALSVAKSIVPKKSTVTLNGFKTLHPWNGDYYSSKKQFDSNYEDDHLGSYTPKKGGWHNNYKGLVVSSNNLNDAKNQIVPLSKGKVFKIRSVLQNPMIVNTKENDPHEYIGGTDFEHLHQANKKGHDGVIYRNTKTGQEAHVNFNSNNVKLLNEVPVDKESE